MLNVTFGGLAMKWTSVAQKLCGGVIVAGVGAALLWPLDAAEAQSVPTIIAPTPSQGGSSGSAAPAVPGQPVLGDIEIQGIQRIEPATVKSYMGLNAGDRLSARRVNEALKTLFGTGLFADVTMEMRGDTLVVRVVENPIINRIAFEGNKRIDDEELDAEVQLRPRVVYTRTRVQSDVQRLLEVYRRSGRFAAQVEPKVIQLEQNRVDLVFEIDEGPKTGVEKISFVGNRFFSDSALRGELATKESRWYRFLSGGDTYDPDRLTFDRELLRRFYLSSGFADFNVVSAVAELTDDRENFFITFTVEEGERYTFSGFDIVSKIPDIDPEPMREIVEIEAGGWYDADIVEDTIVSLTNAVGDQGYAFVDIRPIVDRDRDARTIHVTFEIQEGPRVYVERIDIRGNTRTLDKVVRREFKLVEGDAFNSSLMRRSRSRIRDLQFFSDVQVSNVPGSGPDKTIVQVDVEEQSTGEMTIGAGFSTDDGALAELAIRERNLLGRGQDLSLSTRLAQNGQNVDLSFTEPYFLERELSAGFDVFHAIDDQQDESSFDSKRTGLALRTGYELTDEWRQSLFYRIAREEITNVSSSASLFIRSQEGEEVISAVGHTLTFDRRNSRIDPTDGYFVTMQNEVAGIGGTVNYLKTSFSGGNYYAFNEDVLLITEGEVGQLVGLGQDTRILDRYFLGGRSMRGFASGGLGPRDTSTEDALGGEHLAVASVEVQFPLGLPEEFGLKGAVFSDIGYLSSIPESSASIRDTGSIRSSLGVGVLWASPFGPIRMDFATAVTKEDFDKTETFQFNFGTRF